MDFKHGSIGGGVGFVVPILLEMLDWMAPFNVDHYGLQEAGHRLEGFDARLPHVVVRDRRGHYGRQIILQ